MNGLSKKLSVLLLSVIAAACLCLGALFTVNTTASAATAGTVIVLEDDGYFKKSDSTTLDGLSDLGKATVGDNYFTVKVPEGITAIARLAFNGYANLRSVELPSSLESIGNGAFWGCTSLLSITIPSNVNDISSSAFNGCTRLIEICNNSTVEINVDSSVHVYNPNSGTPFLKSADNNGFVFFADEADEKVLLVDYEGTSNEITLPADYDGSAYEIYRDAFKGDSSLTSVTFPDDANITAIGENAFRGCTSLTKIAIPAGVNTIEDNLFNGCTSLKTVTFNNNFSTLGTSAFANCTSLESINLPSGVSEIKASAFKGCTSLKTVTFNKTQTGIEATNGQYLLKNIFASAFEECRSLEYIELPDSLENVQQNAFKNCVHLSTVYLPANATFGSNVFDPDDSSLIFGGDYARVLLIAPNVESYNSYLYSLEGYGHNLTYVVKLNLEYDGEVHTDYRLLKKEYTDYTYVLQEDGKVWANNGGMPKQEGYKTSVWYEDSNYSNDKKIDGDKLNDILTNGEEITLYAQTVEKPELTPNGSLVYDKEQVTWAEAVGWTPAMAEKCGISISGYKPFVPGSDETLPKVIKDAGTYTLSVALNKEDYGVWEEECTATVVVERAIKDLALLDWITVDGTSLNSNNTLNPYLYFYKNSSGVTVPYIEENTGVTAVEQPKSVINSYLLYSASDQTIVLRDDKNYYGDLTVTYKGNVNRAAGIYTVEAEIPTENNYIFDAGNGMDAVSRETNVSGNYPGSPKCTITKTWYIVAATTNGLVIGGSRYDIPDVWTYKSGSAVNAPEVNFGTASNLVTFSLSYKTIEASNYSLVSRDHEPYARFKDFINDSMPVGDYKLVIYIAVFRADNGTVYEASEHEFDFTVMNTVYKNADGKEVDEIVKIENKNEVRYSPAVRFAEIKDWDKLDTADKLHAIPEGTNFWLDSRYANNYRGFEIRYAVTSDKGSSGGYFTLDDYAGRTSNNPRVKPNTVGVYTVNYIISAPGYASYSGEYTLIVYDVLNLETIQNNINSLNIAYNGEARKPNLDTDVYRAVYLDDATNSEVQSAMAVLGITETCSYINAGKYPVALTVRDSLYVDTEGCYLYRWLDKPDNTSYVEVELNIDKAENKTFTPLTITEWSWGDPASSIIVSWSTDWVKDMSKFTFKLVSEDKSKEPYDLADFSKADSGFYTLKATCPEGVNYKEGSEELIVFVKPAEISWLSAPQIDSWKYGDFEKMFKVPTPVLNTKVAALQAEITGNAKYYREGVTEGSTSLASFADANKQLPVGKYTLVYSYQANGNYSNFRYTVSFQVLKADNYWDIAPVVSGWTYGDKSIDYLTYKPDCRPHYTDGTEVSVQFRIVDENGIERSPWRNRLADLGLDNYGKLSVGYYEVKAELPESANYEAMVFSMRFKVNKAQNSWDAIPNVVSWNEGRLASVDDVLTVVPANGTVLITITDAQGNVIVEDELPENINVNKLNSLGAGAYTLRAYVAGSDRFDELEAFVDFAVFEDSVSQTALIALTMVFAVVAIALAVTGVVLLVRKDKQIEEEFRKMIKAELYRR